MTEYLEYALPLLAAVALGMALWLTDVAVTARARKRHLDLSLQRQSIKLALWIIGILTILLTLPVATSTQGQLITVFGLILTAVLTLSSTTLVSNGLSGVMLRSMENFKPGDFLRVGEVIGRVTERGLMHTEIQTEDGDLTTVPNLHLVSTPYTVVQSSGTVVSATISLGYEVPRRDVEDALLEAAANAGLDQPFAQVIDLQDFAVAYRVAGFLREPKQLLSSRSSLRKHMLDVLHGRGIEIVSPSFMNQRKVDGQKFIPRSAAPVVQPETDDEAPDDKIFDKAEAAQAIEELHQERRELATQLEQLNLAMESATDEQQPLLKVRIEHNKHRQQAIKQTMKNYEDETE